MVTRNKTAPLLLHELLYEYDFRQDSSSAYPLDPPNPCQHAYTTNHDRSSLPQLDQRPDQDTVWTVAALCARCRSHLDLRITFEDSLEPCPNHEFPLHHFIFKGVDSSNDAAGDDDDDEDEAKSNLFQFECSSEKCRAVLETRVRLPVLAPEEVSFLTDHEMIKTRRQATLHNHPDTPEKQPIQVLKTFRTYVEDSLKGKERRRIPAENKVFASTLGLGATKLLLRLGFDYFYMDGGNSSYWMMPSPPEHRDLSAPEMSRALLEDVRDELTILMRQRPESERRLVTEHMYLPPSGTKDFERTLGSLDYETINLPRGERASHSSDLQRYYNALGACADFSDSLISFSFDRQSAVDPTSSSEYLFCLKTIADYRQSEQLATKAVMLESQGLRSSKDIAEAYTSLGIDPTHAKFLTDDHIISQYRARLPDVNLDEQNQMRYALRLLGETRQSQALLQAASDEIKTVEQALSWLDADENTLDEFIPSLVSIKVDENPAQEQTAHKAVEIIADARNSDFLRQYLIKGEAPQDRMDLKQAYSLLDASPDVDDQLLLDSFTIKVADAPGRKTEFTEALTVISQARGSSGLLMALQSEQLGPPGPPVSTDLNEPRGLRNIGNTCYLNSLLQYFFTIKPVRDMVQNSDSYLEDISSSQSSKKKVGDMNVNRKQIIRAQDFVRQLAKLFDSLITDREPYIKPEEILARLTLVNVVREEVRRRSTISKPSNINIRIDPVSPNSASEALVSPQDGTQNETSLTESPTLLRTVEEDDGDTHMDTISTPQDPKDTAETNLRDGSGLSHDAENEVNQNGTADTERMITDSQDIGSIVEHGTANSVESDSKIAGAGGETEERSLEAPPVPPRPDNTRQREDYEAFAQQQDVSEVIENILGQLRWAIKPESTEPNGEQVDMISRLFYGKENYVMINDQKEEKKSQSFFNLWLYLYTGDRGIYSAIDDSLDKTAIEGVPDRFQYRTISQLPPVLQISVSRSIFHKESNRASKVMNQLKLEEIIYMDRYMDEETMIEKRRKSWVYKAQLQQLQAKRSKLTDTKTGLDIPETLKCTAEYLKGIAADADELGIDRTLIDEQMLVSLEKLSEQTRHEIHQIDREVLELENRISDLFKGAGELAYRLHSVFVHRGDASRGHWYIYIYDFEQKLWRLYNDESVTHVVNAAAIMQPDASLHGTSALVVYVRENTIANVIETVCRNPGPARSTASYPGASDPSALWTGNLSKYPNGYW